MGPTRYNAGDRIGDNYLVQKAIAGGMGEIYFCLDVDHVAPIVLKTFQAGCEVSLALRDLFAVEVDYWVRLEKHPHIVRCFYMKYIANMPFMFLEWVVGDDLFRTDLRARLRRGPLTLARTEGRARYLLRSGACAAEGSRHRAP